MDIRNEDGRMVGSFGEKEKARVRYF